MDESLEKKKLEKMGEKKKKIRPTIESRNEIRSRAAIYHRSSGREGWAAWVGASLRAKLRTIGIKHSGRARMLNQV